MGKVLSEEQVERFRRDGYLKFGRVVDDAQVEAMRAALDRIIAEEVAGTGTGDRPPEFAYGHDRKGQDLGTTGWEETLEGGGITVIEWPDRAGRALPEDRVDVHLEHIADTKRRVVLSSTGERSRTLLKEFHDSLGA